MKLGDLAQEVRITASGEAHCAMTDAELCAGVFFAIGAGGNLPTVSARSPSAGDVLGGHGVDHLPRRVGLIRCHTFSRIYDAAARNSEPKPEHPAIEPRQHSTNLLQRSDSKQAAAADLSRLPIDQRNRAVAIGFLVGLIVYARLRGETDAFANFWNAIFLQTG